MSEVKFWNGVYWAEFLQATCPRCKHYILISKWMELNQCQLCGQLFYKEELMPYRNVEACDFDPKRYRRDWIAQEDELEMSRLMGNKV